MSYNDSDLQITLDDPLSQAYYKISIHNMPHRDNCTREEKAKGWDGVSDREVKQAMVAGCGI